MTVSLMCLSRSWLYVLYLCLDSLLRRSTVILSEERIPEPVAGMSFRHTMKLLSIRPAAHRPYIPGMKIGACRPLPSTTGHPPIICRLHGPRTQLLQSVPLECV